MHFIKLWARFHDLFRVLCATLELNWPTEDSLYLEESSDGMRLAARLLHHPPTTQYRDTSGGKTEDGARMCLSLGNPPSGMASSET